MKEETTGGYISRVINSSLQGKLAVASFTSGVVIACVCLFWIEPKGDISNSAISIVSELLVLAGALLGVEANFNLKQKAFASKIAEQLAKKQDKPDNE